MTTWQEEQQAARATMMAALEAVAPRLDAGPWRVETPHDHGARLVNVDGVTVYARLETYGAKSGKLTLTVGSPDGYSYSAGDTHGLTSPSVTVSPTREASALARDISRRLVPAALEYWQAVSDRIARRLSALSARETVARELAEIMGTTAREFRNDWAAEIPASLSGKGPGANNVYGNMTPDYDGESVRVELRGLSVGQARELAAVVAGWAR